LGNRPIFQTGFDLPRLRCLPSLPRLSRITAASFSILLLLLAAQAQTTYEPAPGDHPYAVEGVSETIVYALGHSVIINGTAKNGAFALGGDVIVRGTVDGDVAAVGGSVVQLEGARINGDVMVVGGSYRHADKEPLRGPGGQTIIYTGYEHELRSLMRNPKDLLAPRFSAAYIGLRLLAILFWFIVSLALTAAMPGTISRGIARLQLTLGRVAIIGVLGSLIIGPGVILSLHYLPYAISLLIGLLALLLIVVALLFGRVIIYAATGRWLQRRLLKNGSNSEAVALVLGTTFWITLSSLPYIWPLVVAVVLVTSLGLALTARYRVGWRRQEGA
jgi:hypothetical protein